MQTLLEGKSVFLKKKVSFGMENRGNTCFFNSVMQCLAHTIPLHEFCVADRSHTSFCSNRGSCLLCTYMQFIQKADQSGRTRTEMIEPYMKKIMPAYRFGCQEDAQEFMLGFMDHLIKSCFSNASPVQRYVIKR